MTGISHKAILSHINTSSQHHKISKSFLDTVTITEGISCPFHLPFILQPWFQRNTPQRIDFTPNKAETEFNKRKAGCDQSYRSLKSSQCKWRSPEHLVIRRFRVSCSLGVLHILYTSTNTPVLSWEMTLYDDTASNRWLSTVCTAVLCPMVFLKKEIWLH